MKTQPRAAIIGTGLIGASIGLALGGAAIGWDPDRRMLATARRRGAVRVAAHSLKEAVACADVVVLAAPLDQVIKHLPEVFAAARPGTLVLDVAGVMTPVAAAALPLLKKNPGIQFVAGHPLAGNEHRGAAHADAALFKGRSYALHAPGPRSTAALAGAKRFVRRLGARPIVVEPRAHDRGVAAASALPQLASVALALAVAETRLAVRLAGPGYRDATRLAATAFAQWKPGLRANRLEVLRVVRAFEARVRTLRLALERADEDSLGRQFSAAARARRRIIPKWRRR